MECLCGHGKANLWIGMLRTMKPISTIKVFELLKNKRTYLVLFR